MIKFIRRIHQQSKDGELHLVASALAYSTVLSLIPFMAVCLAILQKLGGLDAFYPKVELWVLSNFSETAGQEGIKLIKIALNRMISGKLGLLGAVFLVVTSTRLISDMDTGINRVWNIKHGRGLVQRMFFYWVLILAFPFGLASYVAVNSTKEYLSLSQQVGHQFFQVLLLSSALFVVYKIVPAVKVKIRSALVGALVGGMVTILVHKSFLWLSIKVFNYGKFYGGIAALPMILLWVLLIWYGILLGAVVSASTKR